MDCPFDGLNRYALDTRHIIHGPQQTRNTKIKVTMDRMELVCCVSYVCARVFRVSKLASSTLSDPMGFALHVW